ncbi:MAG TPA: M6 family metalloprotease domain-containing protein [Sulfurimonas sp.]|nr:M6 family metalloprotease domain-containing protein [Sulfurimonas sp.]
MFLFNVKILSCQSCAVDSYIDFSLYDKNANGHIEVDELQIMFIVGGGEFAAGDNASTSVHAHQFSFDPPPSHDGVTIMSYSNNGTYSVFGEKHGTHFATIGIIAHELGHARWGLPDLYDRDDSSFGIGYFGLMSFGSWGKTFEDDFAGETPTHICAYGKEDLGWGIPTLITESQNNILMHASHNLNHNIIKIPTSDDNIYTLIENRSPKGYDAGLYTMENTPFQGGIAIWHIDKNQITFQNDDETQKLVDLVEANDPELDNEISGGRRTNLFSASF